MTNWNDLSLKERIMLIKHNEQLNSFDINSFVKCKNNGIIRYITNKHDSKRFEDDGMISECQPSTCCWYDYYEMI